MTKRRSSGFMLLEVVVAMVVLTVGIVFVLHSFNSSVNAVKGLDDYLVAMSLVGEKIAEIETKGLDKTGQEGRFNSGYKKFSWKINSLPQQDLSLRKVDLLIAWDTPSSKKSLAVQTYVNEPLLR